MIWGAVSQFHMETPMYLCQKVCLQQAADRCAPCEYQISTITKQLQNSSVRTRHIKCPPCALNMLQESCTEDAHSNKIGGILV